ncbi:MAG: 4Fe-4S dicluster domain-containing protein, partial [Gammaproteobacteria bacterium]|nr:4Fe-4S dicluster domain-containing protein [Gammaproteobacteria bacterium]
MPEAAACPPAVHRQAADPLVVLADQCVQCGLCLPSCPTYRMDLIEAESPRGRIAMARAWALDSSAPTAIGDRHLDQCLGCRRCEVVCPAGVQYGALLVATRARQRERRPVGWRQHAAEWLTSRPRLLKSLLTFYRRAWPLLPKAWRTLPRPPAASRSRSALAGSGDLALFVGCVATAYETDLRQAVARLCAALGLRLSIPAAQA